LRQTPTNSAKIQRAVAAFVTHGSIVKAARAIKTSARNFSRYTGEPEFKRLYAEAIRQQMREVTAKAIANSGQAIAELKKIFSDKKATPGARVAAAVNTIRMGHEGYALEEIEELKQSIRALQEHKNERL
jgi:hypothetical protein